MFTPKAEASKISQTHWPGEVISAGRMGMGRRLPSVSTNTTDHRSGASAVVQMQLSVYTTKFSNDVRLDGAYDDGGVSPVCQ